MVNIQLVIKKAHNIPLCYYGIHPYDASFN